MACAHARRQGNGVCLATSDPSGAHPLNCLYDAKLDHLSVLVITGMQATSQLVLGFQQEVHVEKVFEDVAACDVSVPTLVDDRGSNMAYLDERSPT